MPIVGVGGCEGPFYALPSQAGLDVVIGSNVEVVVKSNEIVGVDLPVNGKGGQCQSQVNANCPIFA